MTKKSFEDAREDIMGLLKVLKYEGEGDREIMADLMHVVMHHALMAGSVRFDGEKFVGYPD